MSSSDDISRGVIAHLIEDNLNRRGIDFSRIPENLSLPVLDYYLFDGTYYLFASFNSSVLSLHCRLLDSRTHYDPNLSNPYVKNFDSLIASAVIEIAHPDRWSEIDVFFDSVHDVVAKHTP